MGPYAHRDESAEPRIDRHEPCDACGQPLGTDYWLCFSWNCFDFMCSTCGPKHDELLHKTDWDKKLEAWTNASGFTPAHVTQPRYWDLRDEKKREA